MDKPSEGANRDAFLWKVLEQFGVLRACYLSRLRQNPGKVKKLRKRAGKSGLTYGAREEEEERIRFCASRPPSTMWARNELDGIRS